MHNQPSQQTSATVPTLTCLACRSLTPNSNPPEIESTRKAIFNSFIAFTQQSLSAAITMSLVRIKQSFCAIFGLLSLMVTLYVLVKFVFFTSKPFQRKQAGGRPEELKVALRHLVNNSIWLVLFILQHSLQMHPSVKKFWAKIGLQTIERSAYNLVSSFILLVSFASQGVSLGQLIKLGWLRKLHFSNWWRAGYLLKSGRCGVSPHRLVRPFGGS